MVQKNYSNNNNKSTTHRHTHTHTPQLEKLKENRLQISPLVNPQAVLREIKEKVAI